MAYCCINDIITSVELPNEIPLRFLHKPTANLDCNGIDLTYTVENQSVWYQVNYTKIIIDSEDVVQSHVAVATVHERQVVPYFF
jgi:hypothetical protein